MEQNIAEMDADPQANRVEFRHGRKARLRLKCTSDGIDCTLEEREEAISRHPEKPSAMRRKFLSGNAPGCPQGIEGVGLVHRNQAAKICHVGREDRSEASDSFAGRLRCIGCQIVHHSFIEDLHVTI
ncbi:MAG: hypothetical protein ACJ8C6_15060 [Microvirga sp.]